MDKTDKILIDLTLGRSEIDMDCLNEYWNQLIPAQRRKVVDLCYESYLNAAKSVLPLTSDPEIISRMKKLEDKINTTAKELGMIGKQTIWTRIFGPKKYEVRGGENQFHIQHAVTGLNDDQLIAVAKYFGTKDADNYRGQTYELYQIVINHTLSSIVKQWAFGNYLHTGQLN